MKVSDFVAGFLARQGIDCVFEMSGGMIAHLLDSLNRLGQVKVVSMHHEQGAAFAADAYGRVTGRPGVALATSGPGATNLLTGVGSCYFDSSPAMFITGQVNRHELRGSRAIRQLGFQETDIVAMAAPITKRAVQVQDAEQVPHVLADSLRLACEGRPGPVLIDIPMDVQRADIGESPSRIPLAAPPPPRDQDVSRVLERLAQAARPLLLVGGGIRAARAREALRAFVEATRIPVVASLMAVDALPASSPSRYGMIGSYGNRWANLAIDQSDVILVLGSRLDIRQTGADVKGWKKQREILHVDCDAGEINNRVMGCEAFVADVRAFLEQATIAAQARPWPAWTDWKAALDRSRASWPDTSEVQTGTGVNPNVFMRQLSTASGQAAAYVVDVGQHQMWAAQSLQPTERQRFLTSGGMGSMGFALPAAIGACFGLPDSPVVVIAGDGGFQANIQELETVVRNRLPLKIVVVNNQSHGMVRQFQESYFEGRYQSTLWGYSAPDFEKVAEAYGIPAATVAKASMVGEALELLWNDPSQPFLLQVMVDPTVNAYPKIAFGRPMTDMEPLAKPADMEGT